MMFSLVSLCAVAYTYGSLERMPLQVLRHVPEKRNDLLAEPLSLAEATPNSVPVPLDNMLNVMYLAEVTLGVSGNHENPPVKVQLIVDTGSSDMWVTGKAVMKHRHMPEEIDFGDLVSVEYGKGKIAGMYVNDTVCVSSHLCIDKQGMLIAQKVEDIGGNNFEGLLGLGFPMLEKLRSLGCVPFLERLNNSQTFKHMAFLLDIHAQKVTYTTEWDWSSFRFVPVPHMEKTRKDQSYIVFGELDEVIEEAKRQTCDSCGAVVPVVTIALPLKYQLAFNDDGTKKPYWWLMRFGVAFQDGQMLKHEVGALDSGTSALTAPKKAYEALHGQLIEGLNLSSNCSKFDDIFKNAGKQVPQTMKGVLMCTCDTQLNPITFTFNDSYGGPGLNITLTSSDVLLPVTGQFCFVGIMESPKNASMWLLGDIILRKVYAVHDYEGEKIHLFARNQDDHSGRTLDTASNGALRNEDEFQSRSKAHALRESSDVQATWGVMVLISFVIVGAISVFRRRRGSGSVNGYARF